MSTTPKKGQFVRLENSRWGDVQEIRLTGIGPYRSGEQYLRAEWKTRSDSAVPSLNSAAVIWVDPVYAHTRSVIRFL
jgi:hypothetical protein